MTDSIADMLIRIKNGQMVKAKSVYMPHSKFKKDILKVLQNEGYIKSYEEKLVENTVHKGIVVYLKYADDRKPVIRDVRKVSKPGRRIYSSIDDLKGHYNNLGITILSTSKGVMSDNQARKAKVGGEILCQVF